MSAYCGASVTLTGSGDPAQIRGARVTHEFFETIGIVPLQGRAFSSANGQAGGERVVIVAHALWMRRFGADASIIGRRIVLDGVPHEVIGVMPASFKHPDAELWMPLAPVGEFQALFGARGSYFPLRRGRMFTRADGAQFQQVVMVNETFVRRFFQGEDPLGRRVTLEDSSQPGTRWQTIVGVVADTKRGGFEREPWAETYFPMRQAPDPQAFVLLRTNGDPITLIAAAQAAVWSIDHHQANASIRTVPELLAQRELNRRFTTLLLGVFASVALVLAIIGTYGVVAHATAQRTQEIGIRMALGAERRTILRTVLVGGLRIAATGLAIGVSGALALTQVLSGLLFGVSARDPLTFVVVPGALLVVALAACWIPARRAMQVEPVIALRGDS
jgi:hypothetical protein